MELHKVIGVFILLFSGCLTYGQSTPLFQEGEDPKPKDAKWKLVKSMSDEFTEKRLNKKKWTTTGQKWIGRPPGLFMPENIKVADGTLQVTTVKLSQPVVKQNKTFTHGGGHVMSKNSMTYGYYECRMKANKTFMSSTFWLYNAKYEGQGCDRRNTELDIQESVGQIVGENPGLQKFDSSMNFNTHSRNIEEGCDVAKGIIGGNASINEKVYDDFHVFGAWWKSKDEILFFLDGKFVKKIKPVADFSLPMYIRMVVETYNWNPPPEDGGMNMSVKDRTTYYDWVRTWELKG
ncbi:hypothetical protein MHTCC0001_28690 [Flavobacteriaceae bacterium MHTCC 0001]